MGNAQQQNSVSIREYRGDVDFPGLVAFIAMQYEHEREQQADGKRHGGRMAPQYAQELVDTLEARNGCLLVADVGATPVGFIAAYQMSDPDPVLEDSARTHGYVRDLFVLPNWRRMGVASRLIVEAERHFRDMGVTRLRLAGTARNESMTGLCKAIGYQPYAVVYDRAIPQPTHSVQGGKIIKGAS